MLIFEKEDIAFTILDVMTLRQGSVNMPNGGRHFGALSYRLSSDARLTTATSDVAVGDHTVVYIPSRLDYRRAATHDDLIVIHFEALNYSGEEIEAFTAREPEVFRALFSEILTIWQKKELGYRQEASAVFCRILAECYRETYRQRDTASRIERSVEALHHRYTDPTLTIGEIARCSFMSEVYFRRLFKERFGISPQKYVIGLRIRHAIGLLATGYHTPREVAYLSGYTDYKYFSVEFKRVTGVSPTKYRYNYSE